MCVMRCSVFVCWAIVNSTSNMFQHYHQVKSIHSRNYRWVQYHSCRLHDVPVVIIDRQCIELNGLSQIVPDAYGPEIASKNAYFGLFCTEPDRALPDSTDPFQKPYGRRCVNCAAPLANSSLIALISIKLYNLSPTKA